MNKITVKSWYSSLFSWLAISGLELTDKARIKAKNLGLEFYKKGMTTKQAANNIKTILDR